MCLYDTIFEFTSGQFLEINYQNAKGTKILWFCPRCRKSSTEQVTQILDQHTCRHTFAKSLIDNGVSLEKVAVLLGHESLDTTHLCVMGPGADHGGVGEVKSKSPASPEIRSSGAFLIA